ncbi:glycoside hydrolase superfamily [Crucibulum laeve]|uniref:glucan 1,3-beta-glucosidase n=1 Tax=Crucibulum laeve TaxID=68775 RepID=A0A5C3LIA5_9AGAR|nr:glycoside hydrolase superfamily [Crucibulum laeve]
MSHPDPHSPSPSPLPWSSTPTNPFSTAPSTPTPHTPAGLIDEQQPMLPPPQARWSNPFSSPAPSPAPSTHAQLNPNDQTSKEGVFAAADPDSSFGSSSQLRGRKGVTRKRKLLIAGLVLLLLLIIFLAVFLPILFLVIRKNNQTAAGGGKGGGGGGGGGGNGKNPASPSGAISGGDGSTVVLANGTSFVYSNSFGGFWHQDPNDPFATLAQPNSWTPPLNTTWRWGVDRIYGVNLGGLFVLEPFISPDLFQRYPGSAAGTTPAAGALVGAAVDEYTLSQAMAADTAAGGLEKQLEAHYATFVTEQDIAEIAGAGLNFIRVPIAFWAIETWEGEPYLAQVSWRYFLQILDWARKYGLRVCLDLHAVPGSQNGYNHSGRLAPVNFLNGNMGLANAQRTLYYIRVLAEFIAQPQYRDLIPIFGIVNEALVGLIGMDAITSFYQEAISVIRGITGQGEGNGPYIAIHDGFLPLSNWANFLQGADRLMLDTHPYFSFGGPMLDPIAVPGDSGMLGGKWPKAACDNWGPMVNQSRQAFGVTIAGEFSGSPNDCGLFLLGVGTDSTNPQCPEYDDWENFNSTMKEGIKNFIEASFDALGDWFFWTWKIGPSQTSGRIETPLWSYQLGLRNGWIPTDPREAIGKCAALSAASVPFDGTFSGWQTGAPTSSIAASSSSLFPWPPTTLSGISVPMSLVPTYTTTGSVTTMPVQTYSGAPASVTKSDDGWFDKQDTEGGVVTVSGCPYPSEYDGIFQVVPTAPCTGPGDAPASTITPAPAA